MSDFAPINRLPHLHTIQRVTLRGSQLEMQWVAEDGRWYELEIPFPEACTLVGYLRNAFRRESRLRGDHNKRLSCSIKPKEQTTKLSPVKKFQGICLAGLVANLQWKIASGEWHELKMPLQAALVLLDALEDALPFDRKPSDDVAVDFGEPISVNALAGFWQAAYYADRYLKELTDEALDERIDDVLANAMRMHDDGKLRPIWYKDQHGFYKPDRGIDWLRLLTDTHTELGIRGDKFDRQLPTIRKTKFPRRLEDEMWCRRPDLVR